MKFLFHTAVFYGSKICYYNVYWSSPDNYRAEWLDFGVPDPEKSFELTFQSQDGSWHVPGAPGGKIEEQLVEEIERYIENSPQTD